MPKRKKTSAIVRQAVRSISIDAALANANDPIEVAAGLVSRGIAIKVALGNVPERQQASHAVLENDHPDL